VGQLVYCYSLWDSVYSSVWRGVIVFTLRYDMTRKKSLTWTQKLNDQLNLAHVTGKDEIEETKTNKRQFQVSSVQVQDA